MARELMCGIVADGIVMFSGASYSSGGAGGSTGESKLVARHEADTTLHRT